MTGQIEKIQKYTQSVIFDLYHIEYSVLFLRQRRVLGAGAKNFIDFSFPAFKVANILSVDAISVAARIAQKLNKEYGDDKIAVFEAVDGYVNLQLSDETLRDIRKNKKQYYKKSRNDGQVLFIYDRSDETTALFKSYTHDMFRRFGFKARHLDLQNTSEKSAFIKYDNRISDLLIVDKYSKAAYMDLNGNHFGIRDAKGLNTKESLLLNELGEILKSKKVFLMTSINQYEFVRSLLDYLESDDNVVIHLEPNTVKADLKDLASKAPVSLSQLYDSIEATLDNILENVTKLDSRGRVELLDVLFFYKDIGDAFELNNMPMIFDRINQAFDSIDYLKDAHANHD